MSSLINQHGPKLQLGKSRISSTNASAANDIRSVQNLPLALPDQGLVFPFIIRAQLALLVLQHDQLLQLNVASVFSHLLMQSQEGDRRIESFTRLGRDPHNLETCGVNLLGQLVYSDIGGSADEHGARVHFGKVIDYGRGGHGLASSGRSLNEGDGFLQDALYGVHL